MSIRSTVRSRLESVVGEERVRAAARTERAVRTRLASAIAPAAPPPKKKAAKKPAKPKPVARTTFQPSDPFTPHPEPTMSRHDLLAGLHERLQPRTYLEVGVRNGESLALSSTRSIGVDPAYSVDREIEADVQLVRATSDDFFAREDPLAHFAGVPVDLAFIDGMHLSEFALRDFLNTEPHLARTGVVVFDDMLPRNSLEAARVRRTAQWAGDVYKVAEVLRRRRPDLVVLLVNTSPTGTVVVAGVDPATALKDAVYEAELAYCLAPDPQDVPSEYLDRSTAVNARALLELSVWDTLVKRRESDNEPLDDVWDQLRSLPVGG
ncbi:class I SAM-dependent methyltransferase [Mumia sp. Pv 4-285]|uniref:class I SAM-dependent methyltransferase n=1 Tax=Mumia qirimensis TaxID=3234852 RepID=UPI00351D6135